MARTVRLYADESKARGWPGFVQWLARTHPDVYGQARIINADAFDTASFGSDELSGWADSLASTVTNVANAVLPVYTQKKLLDIQIQRAKAGQAPLDTSAYNSVQDSAAMRVGLASDTRNTLFILGGLAVAALLVFKLLGRR